MKIHNDTNKRHERNQKHWCHQELICQDKNILEQGNFTCPTSTIKCNHVIHVIRIFFVLINKILINTNRYPRVAPKPCVTKIFFDDLPWSTKLTVYLIRSARAVWHWPKVEVSALWKFGYDIARYWASIF